MRLGYAAVPSSPSLLPPVLQPCTAGQCKPSPLMLQPYAQQAYLWRALILRQDELGHHLARYLCAVGPRLANRQAAVAVATSRQDADEQEQLGPLAGVGCGRGAHCTAAAAAAGAAAAAAAGKGGGKLHRRLAAAAARPRGRCSCRIALAADVTGPMATAVASKAGGSAI